MSPSSGPNHAIDLQYYHETYVYALQPICKKVANRLVTLTRNLMQWSDPPMHNLLTEVKDALLSKAQSKEIGQVHYYRVKIVTQGIPPSTRHPLLTGPCLGWSSTDHIDNSSDTECTEMHHDAINILKNWSPLAGIEERVWSYLNKFLRRHKLGVPTCCGTKYVGKSCQINTCMDTDLHYYFIISGLHLAVRICPLRKQYFYAHIFSHNTSPCIAVKGGCVFLSDPSNFQVFTWGASGK
jgi:hypothetical protein